MNFIKFKPIYISRIWGGNAFKTKLKRKISAKNIGESWEICDRLDAQSEVSGGKFKGKSLEWLMENYSEEIMGKKWKAKKRFPLLIKWLDCNDRLSLQVHPDSCLAKKFKSEEKSEAWYIYDCRENSQFNLGLKKNVTKKDFIESYKSGNLKKYLNVQKSNRGDFVIVKAGSLHSLGANNLILEIQQNSDTTYKLYDWDRVDLNGKKRVLNEKEALECINFKLPKSKIQHFPKRDFKTRKLCKEKIFSITEIRLKAGEIFSVEENQQARIILMFEGGLISENGELKNFDSALLPYSQNFNFIAKFDSSFLLVENFY